MQRCLEGLEVLFVVVLPSVLGARRLLVSLLLAEVRAVEQVVDVFVAVYYALPHLPNRRRKRWHAQLERPWLKPKQTKTCGERKWRRATGKRVSPEWAAEGGG